MIVLSVHSPSFRVLVVLWLMVQVMGSLLRHGNQGFVFFCKDFFNHETRRIYELFSEFLFD